MLPVLTNMTLNFEGWLRSKFYAHLSENRVEVNNVNKQLRVSVRVEPSLSAVDVMLFKPNSNTFFRHLPLSKTANVVFPLSAKSSLTERLIDNTISDGFARNNSFSPVRMGQLFHTHARHCSFDQSTNQQNRRECIINY